MKNGFFSKNQFRNFFFKSKKFLKYFSKNVLQNCVLSWIIKKKLPNIIKISRVIKVEKRSNIFDFEYPLSF